MLGFVIISDCPVLWLIKAQLQPRQGAWERRTGRHEETGLKHVVSESHSKIWRVLELTSKKYNNNRLLYPSDYGIAVKMLQHSPKHSNPPHWCQILNIAVILSLRCTWKVGFRSNTWPCTFTISPLSLPVHQIKQTGQWPYTPKFERTRKDRS